MDATERLGPEAARLLEVASRLRIVDAHEHLGPERPIATDLCRLIGHDNYLGTDLVAAGMEPAAMHRLRDLDVPLSERWRSLAPFWRLVRHGAYARGLRKSLATLYGIRGLEGETDVAEASERLGVDFGSPGIFARVLHGACGIDEVLTQGAPVDRAPPRFRWLARPLDRADFGPDGGFEEDARSLGLGVRTVEDVCAAMDGILARHRERGACGFKIAALPWAEPSRREVREALVEARRHRPDGSAPPPLDSYRGSSPLVRLYVSRIAARAAEFDIPVAVHTGFPYTNWLDYRAWEPTAIIPLLLRFRGTRFDLYHAGLPWGTPAGPLAKAFPNVWHDLTWAHLVSPELAMRSIREWLDLVPVSKVIGFGGDYTNETVALVVGHLGLARENLARALGERVREGSLGEEDVREILKLWLVENPRALYLTDGTSGPARRST
jgi:predicted TIM-barrel fold metal-dependent hydrolase